MSRISSYISQIDEDWVKTNQQFIHKHPAWREGTDALQAKKLLAGKAPFTYLLHEGDRQHAYFITFVKEDYSIYHQSFTLEQDFKGWYYKNGMPRKPTETVDELIPQMMHCNPRECIALNRL